MIAELFHLHILNMTRISLHTRRSGSFRRKNLFVFRNRLTKNSFLSPKCFWGFRETGLLISFDIKSIFVFFYYINQETFMLPWVCTFKNRSQESSKYGKNISDTVGSRFLCHLFVVIRCQARETLETKLP